MSTDADRNRIAHLVTLVVYEDTSMTVFSGFDDAETAAVLRRAAEQYPVPPAAASAEGGAS